MMLDSILDTYSSLISIRKNLPGMSIQSAFENLKCLEDEYKWLQELKRKEDSQYFKIEDDHFNKMEN